MTFLRDFRCVPCRGDAPPATGEEIAAYRKEVPDWQIVEREGVPRLERTFAFKDFVQALEFTNQVGAAAEVQDHHPVLVTEWGRVKVSWWTHKIKGLHRNDFIMAAKTDAIYES